MENRLPSPHTSTWVLCFKKSPINDSAGEPVRINTGVPGANFRVDSSTWRPCSTLMSSAPFAGGKFKSKMIRSKKPSFRFDRAASRLLAIVSFTSSSLSISASMTFYESVYDKRVIDVVLRLIDNQDGIFPFKHNWQHYGAALTRR